MNLIIDYRKAIHPQCGKEIKIHKDIIITPFYTAQFCDELVKMAKFYTKNSLVILLMGKIIPMR